MNSSQNSLRRLQSPFSILPRISNSQITPAENAPEPFLSYESEAIPSKDAVLSKEHWTESASAIRKEFDVKELEIFRNIEQQFTSPEDKAGRYAAYGGERGNRIFKEISSKIIVPMMTDLFKKFVEDTSKVRLSYEENINSLKTFLEVLLDAAGKDRKLIAKLSCSKDCEEFGRRVTQPGRLADRVGNTPEWKPWNKKIDDLINSLIHPEWKDYYSKTDNPAFRTFLKMKDGPLRSFKNANIEAEFTTKGRGWLQQRGKRGNKVSHYEFEWDTQADACRKFTHPIEIKHLKCNHPAMGNKTVEDAIATDVLHILFLKRTSPYFLRDLKDKLATVFYEISHSTTFVRGQASISEALIKSLAAFHGYNLEFSSAWSAPDNPSPDQQALSELGFTNFMLAARDNILLTENQNS